MNFRLIGALILCLGSAALGFSASGKIKKSVKMLQQLKDSLARMRCEVSYALKPVGQICAELSAETESEVSVLYQRLSECYRGEYPTREGWAKSVVGDTLRSIPATVSCSVTELIDTFGKYGLQEQLHMIDLTLERIGEALVQLSAEKSERCKCYETLGLCTGLAVAILVL